MVLTGCAGVLLADGGSQANVGGNRSVLTVNGKYRQPQASTQYSHPNLVWAIAGEYSHPVWYGQPHALEYSHPVWYGQQQTTRVQQK